MAIPSCKVIDRRAEQVRAPPMRSGGLVPAGSLHQQAGGERPATRYRDGPSIGVVRALYSAFWSCRPLCRWL